MRARAKQSTSTRHTPLAPVLAASALLTGLVHGAAVIYEPFVDPDGAANSVLNGNATGDGLSGNWSDSRHDEGTTISYGSLVNSGGSADNTRLGGGWSNTNATIDTSAAFTALLANGGDLWFSLLLNVTVNETVDRRFAFGLTTDGFGSGNGNLAAGQGIGFGITTASDRIYSHVWDSTTWGNNLQNAPSSSTGINQSGAFGAGTYFIVGHAEWGADGATNDKISLYLPGTDLVLGTAVATAEGLVDQGAFDNLGIHYIRTSHIMDEIRVGATYADVSPSISVPEPSAALLGGLGALLLFIRRRS